MLLLWRRRRAVALGWIETVGRGWRAVGGLLGRGGAISGLALWGIWTVWRRAAEALAREFVRTLRRRCAVWTVLLVALRSGRLAILAGLLVALGRWGLAI